MAVNPRKYDAAYNEAVKNGYTGSYISFAKKQAPSNQKGAPAFEQGAKPTVKPSTASTQKKVIGMTALEELVQLIGDSAHSHRGQFMERVEGIVGDRPGLAGAIFSIAQRMQSGGGLAEELVEEPSESQAELEARRLEEKRQLNNHRYGRHQVVEGLTMCFMKHYQPNFSLAPSGWILVTERKSGNTFPFYFKLYTELELNPPAFMGSFGYSRTESNYGRSAMAMGPNPNFGLDCLGSDAGYISQRIQEIAAELFTDEAYLYTNVMYAPTGMPSDPGQPLRLMTDVDTDRRSQQLERDQFTVGGVTVELTEVSGYSHVAEYDTHVRISFPGVEKDSVRFFQLNVQWMVPERANLSGCCPFWLAREIATRLAFVHPTQIGVGSVCVVLGREITRNDARAAVVVL